MYTSRVTIPVMQNEDIGLGIQYDSSGNYVLYPLKPGQEKEWLKSAPEVAQIIGGISERDYCESPFPFKVALLSPSELKKTIELVQKRLNQLNKSCWYDGFSRLLGNGLYSGAGPKATLLQKCMTENDKNSQQPLQLAHMVALGCFFVPCKVSVGSWTLRREALFHACESAENIGIFLLLILKTGYQGMQSKIRLQDRCIYLLECIGALVLGELFCIASIIKGLAAAVIHPSIVYTPNTALKNESTKCKSNNDSVWSVKLVQDS